MPHEYLIYDQKDYVATITLNRPEVHNSLNAQMLDEIINALQTARKDPEVRVIVLRGSGEKAFCTGMELGTVLENNEGNIIDIRNHISKYADALLALTDAGKPTIAAVQGYALAGGCGLAVACDLTIASEQAKFGVPEVNVGMWGMIITAPILRTVHMKKGLELLYTGKHISAIEAEQIGLINRVVPHQLLSAEVSALAKELANKSPLVMSLGREAFYASRDMDYYKAVNYLKEMASIVAGSDDAREGIEAFKEKRAPRWSIK